MAYSSAFDETKIQRLWKSIRWSQGRLKHACEQRMDVLRQLTGMHYLDNAAEDKVPVNLLSLAIGIYSRQLASNAPSVLITTPHQELLPNAADMQLVVNHILRHELNFVQTMQDIVTDALLSIGIAKVGLCASPNSENEQGFLHDPGQPFVDHILLEDFVVDMKAKRWDQIAYCGDRYCMAVEDVLANQDFDAKARDVLAKRSDYSVNVDSDTSSTSLQRGNESALGDDDFIPHLELWDIWIPRYGVVVTMAHEDIRPLRIIEWKGPENGPYHFLGFRNVPGNLLPLPPVAMWRDLHELTNGLFNKLGRQAERQKTVYGVMPGGDSDGQRALDANDGDVIKLQDPKNVATLNFPGIDQGNFAFTLQLKQLFNQMSGNLDALGGLGTSSDTVGQDKLLASNASEMVKEMQDRSRDFFRKIVKDLAWYEFHNPMPKRSLLRPIEGTSISIPFTDSSEWREGDFFEYNFDIEPESMQPQTSSEKLSTLTNLMTNILLPMMPAMQAMGITLNFEGFLKIIEKYGHLPEVKDLITYMEGEVDPENAGMPSKPNSTTRNYVRESRAAGATDEAQQNIMASSLMGVKPQAANQAAAAKALTG